MALSSQEYKYKYTYIYIYIAMTIRSSLVIHDLSNLIPIYSYEEWFSIAMLNSYRLLGTRREWQNHLSGIWGCNSHDVNHFHPQSPQRLLNYVPSPAALCTHAYFSQFQNCFLPYLKNIYNTVTRFRISPSGKLTAMKNLYFDSGNSLQMDHVQ